MTAFYSDSDPYVCAWARNLIVLGLAPEGRVDEQPIQEVDAADLAGFAHCHFFAGILGWPRALRLAGWADDRPVWTASCPCQPLSSAGQRKGHADERHLWPALYRLIAECRPATVFGEQVGSKDGREWLAGVRADLEHLGYAVGAADLPAACVGAPHIRQRLWWVANSNGTRWHELRRCAEQRKTNANIGACSGRPLGVGRLADDRSAGLAGRPLESARQEREAAERSGAADGMGDAESQRFGQGSSVGRGGDQGEYADQGAGPLHQGKDFWSGSVLIPCLDGKARRVEPSVQPLAHGVPGRVGRLRAYGNAIVPQVAAKFIRAVMECRP